MYFGAGTLSFSDLTGIAVPSAPFGLATGTGSTALSADPVITGGTAGQYATTSSFQPGLGAGVTITVVLVAWNTSGGSYAGTTGWRGHSAPFQMVTSVATAFPALTGDAGEAGFQVLPVPEPTTLALSGLGGLALLLMRRKQS